MKHIFFFLTNKAFSIIQNHQCELWGREPSRVDLHGTKLHHRWRISDRITGVDKRQINYNRWQDCRDPPIWDAIFYTAYPQQWFIGPLLLHHHLCHLCHHPMCSVLTAISTPCHSLAIQQQQHPQKELTGRNSGNWIKFPAGDSDGIVVGLIIFSGNYPPCAASPRLGFNEERWELFRTTAGCF